MQRVLSILTIVSLLLCTTPALVIAQSTPNGDTGQAGQIFLPLIRGQGALSVEGEEDIDSGLQSAGIGRDTLVAADRNNLRQRPLPSTLATLQLAQPERQENVNTLLKLSTTLANGSGRQRVIVRLRTPSVVQQVLGHVTASSAASQQAHLAVLQSEQASVIASALQIDGATKVLGQVQKALNAVMLEIDASALPALAANPAVLAIRPVINYSVALSETVPYIGGTAVQELGFDGTGVTVAVLDSGIDYLHANLGGSGDASDYTSNDPAMIEEGTFPTEKVVGGYDFVGSTWPDTDEVPDADPLDDGPEAGHGTHVADIIGGRLGVAPGVDLYAVKVCSSISTSCSGVALLQGVDYALDPNNDGDISDAVDVINLSLGSDYGNENDDDLSLAVEYASAYGVIVVASAGNGGDKPYIHGTPASAPSVIAVAQTNVPSAYQSTMQIKAPASIAGTYEATFQSWSVAPTAVLEGPVQYGDGAGGNLNGCAAFAPGSLTGKIVLVNRGSCNFTLKLANISQGGALAGIVGLIAPGDPFDGSDGGDRPIDIPGYMINQAAANRIKSELANGVIVSFDPAGGIPLVGHMVGSSSRGPTVGIQAIKPDVGAPGASVSALAGTGSGEGAFGGTSGAAPMVSGAAALLRQAFPTRSVAEIKSLLMNTAETNIYNRLTLFGGDLAPITRIGGGEIRVDRAAASPAAAWDTDTQTGSLSFNFHDIAESELVLKRLVTVRNYSERNITYQIAPTFRFANDVATNAVKVSAPSSVFVPARGDAQFEVVLTVYSKRLLGWTLNSGAEGANPDPLTLHEYDGYLQLTEKGNASSAIHLAWQILSRQAGDVSVTPRSKYIQVRNRGVGTNLVESYSLIGVSSNLPEGGPGDNNPTPDYRYLGYSTYQVPAGVCNDTTPSFVMAFAANTWERQTHAVTPASYYIELDTNQDGENDYAVLTRDVSFSDVTDGRNLTWVADLATGLAEGYFFTDHETNSANTVMLFCAEQIGMTLDDALTPINVTAYVDDFYFGGMGDEITGITIAPFGEQYVGEFEIGGIGSTTLAPGAKDKLTVLDFGPLYNNTESGLLLLFRGGSLPNREAGTIMILP